MIVDNIELPSHFPLPVLPSSSTDMEAQHTNPDPDTSSDEIQPGEIMSNWAKEFCDNLGMNTRFKNDEMDTHDSMQRQ